ncbi:MAG: hypothetical protein UY62_C0088G0006, partial [Parcubacteria group bacterium GW2011_GWF2_50_9]
MVDGGDDAVFVQCDNSLGGRIHDRPVSQGLFLFLAIGSGNGQGIFDGCNDSALVCPELHASEAVFFGQRHGNPSADDDLATLSLTPDNRRFQAVGIMKDSVNQRHVEELLQQVRTLNL